MAGGNPRKPPLPPQPPIAAAAGKRRGTSAEAAAANPHELRRLQVGDEAEVMIRRKLNGLGDSWFPATVCSLVDELNYEVVLPGEVEPGKTPKKYQVGREKIRPAADAERFSPGTRLEPRAAVEAFCLGAWSRGEVVRRADNSDGRSYLVKVGSKRRRETTEAEIMELKDLRPPSHKANLIKRPSSPPIEVTSDDDEHSNDHEYTAIEKANREPQLLPMVLAQGSEHASMVVDQSFLPPLNKSPSSSFLLSGYSTPQDKSTPSTGENPNPVNEDTLPNTVLSENQRGKTHAIESFMGNNDSSNNVSGQALHGSTRKVITHLKSLRRKQAGVKKLCGQHRSLDQSVVLEEEPLGLMQSFNSIIESAMIKSPIEDSDASFEERNLIFSRMKANLEYVQSSHHRMTEKKSQLTKHVEEKGAVEAQQQEERNSMSQMYLFLEENDVSMVEFQQEAQQLQQKLQQVQQKVEQHRQKGQKIENDIQHKESELKRLDEVHSEIEKACDNDEQEILSIMAEVRQKLHIV